MSTTITSEFLDGVQRLGLRLARVPHGGSHGEHRTTHAGAGVEFRDFQAYSPGHDLRRVDWNVYRRTGHLFLRRYEQPETAAVHIIVDVSQSMFCETPRRIDAAAQVAAALSVAALGQMDVVDLYLSGTELQGPVFRATGRRGIPGLTDVLSEFEPQLQTNLPLAIRTLAAARRRAGLVVLISDFFDDRGILEIAAALALLRDRVLLVRIAQPTDANPDIAGHAELVDCESGTSRIVSPTPRALAAYRRAYARFIGQLEGIGDGRGVRYVEIDASRPVADQLCEHFRNGWISV